MTLPKIPVVRDVSPPNLQVATSPGTPAGQKSNHQGVTHFRGAFFQQGGLANLPRRGPTPRMPLKSANATKRASSSGRKKNDYVAGDADGDFSSLDGLESEHDSGYVDLHFNTSQDRDESSQNEGDREHRRFNRMFEMAPTAIENKSSSIRTTINRVQERREATPLPPMTSLADLVGFIHTSVKSDPSGKSLGLLLRRLNAAVMRNEIPLPTTAKIADVRQTLIDIFGVGHNVESTSPSMQNIYRILPLWLMNLGRKRTAMQQCQAAARLTVPFSAGLPG